MTDCEALGHPLLCGDACPCGQRKAADRGPTPLGAALLASVETADRRHRPAHNALNGKWSHHHDACQDCGTTSSPHAGRGRCDRCRMRVARAS